MLEWFRSTLSETGFMPHIHCYLAKPGIVWTMFITDMLIGLAYLGISITLYVLVKQIKIQFSAVVLCFGVFIGACGATHFMEVWTLWNPDYWLSATVKIITAAASVGTGIYLYRLRHPLVQIAEAARLADQQRLDLEVLTKELELRVEERTQAAHQSEAQLRLIADSVPVLISYVDSSLRYRSVNATYERWFGKSKEEILGKSLEEVLGADAYQIARAHAEAALSGQTVKFERVVNYPAVGPRNVETTYLPHVDPKSKKITGFVVMVNDITDQVQSREQLQRWEHVFQNASWGISLATPDSRFIAVNRAFADMHGSTPEEWIGRSLLDMFAEESKPLLSDLQLRVADTGHIQYESVHIRKDGSTFPVQTEVTAFFDETRTPIFRAANYQDITERKRSEQALERFAAASERGRVQLEAVFQSVSDGIAVFDSTGYIIMLNESLARMNGYESSEEMMRDISYFARIYEFQYPDGRPVPVSEWPVSQVLAGKTIKEIELIGRRKDTGREWYFSFSGAPILTDTGDQGLAVVVTRDITAQAKAAQALQESEERFRTYAEAMPQMAFIADAEGRLTYFNRRFYEYVGKDKEVDGWDWIESSIHHPDDLQTTIDTWNQSVLSGNLYQIEYRLRRHDGEYRWHLGRAIPLKDASGRVRQWVGTNTDIHDQKETQRRLEESLRVRDDFLSIASHELKTPLASLQLQTQLTQRLIKKGDPSVYSPERVGQLVDQTDRQTRRLTRLVEDMLDISRIRSGKLSISKENLDLGDLIQDTVERLRLEMNQAGTPPELHWEKGIRGNWDRMRIEQAIINLLTNAMRYGNKKPIHIALEKVSAIARITVKDQGLGIEKEAQERIFERFQREISANEVSGLGLGLFITRQIIEAHQGKIWVESEGPGKGSAFVIELPL